MTPLSPLTQQIMEKIFPQTLWMEVTSLLETQCGQNLPLCQDGTPESMQRIRFAALKVSEGNMEKFHEAIDLAKLDWRDLLVWAGFANDITAHDQWAKQIMEQK